MKTFIKLSAVIVAVVSLSSVAFAQSSTTTVNASSTSSGPAMSQKCIGTKTAKCSIAEQKTFDWKARAVKEIDRRVESLNKLQDRIHEMRNITTSQKNSIIATVQSEIGNLTILKNEIITETDNTKLKEEIKSITQGQRVYALVMPQTNIIAAGDRITTVISMLNTIGSKLQGRIAGDTSYAANTTIQTNMKEFTDKIADAQTQVQDANAAVVALTPDNGDKTKYQSNLTALKDARKKIQAAQQDLVTARKDAQAIAKILGTNIKKDVTASSTPKKTAK